MLQLPLVLAQEAAVRTDQWSHEFFGLDQEQRFVVLLVLLGCASFVLTFVTAALSGTYYYLQRRRGEMELKRDMLDRGMSAEEIVQVIKAAPVEDAASRWVEGWREKKS